MAFKRVNSVTQPQKRRERQKIIPREIAHLTLWVLLPVLIFKIATSESLNIAIQALKTQRSYNSHANTIVTFGAIGNYGRLGNQFFQAASTIGIALSHGLKPDFPSSIHQTDLGSLCNLHGTLQPKDLDTSYVVHEEHGTYYNISLPMESRIISLFGYFQSPLYFDNFRAELKSLFKINGQITKQILEELPEIKSSTSVAIHVRRGDYLNLGHIYKNLDIDYYIRALHSLGKVDTVIITSDDITWCRQNFQMLPYKIIFSSLGDHLRDFVLLALSKNLIMSNSSYSWWAAYLKMLHFGNGTVIAPKPWYTPDGPLTNLNRDDFYLSHWKVIKV